MSSFEFLVVFWIVLCHVGWVNRNKSKRGRNKNGIHHKQTLHPKTFFLYSILSLSPRKCVGQKNIRRNGKGFQYRNKPIGPYLTRTDLSLIFQCQYRPEPPPPPPMDHLLPSKSREGTSDFRIFCRHRCVYRSHPSLLGCYTSFT